MRVDNNLTKNTEDVIWSGNPKNMPDLETYCTTSVEKFISQGFVGMLSAIMLSGILASFFSFSDLLVLQVVAAFIGIVTYWMRALELTFLACIPLLICVDPTGSSPNMLPIIPTTLALVVGLVILLPNCIEQMHVKMVDKQSPSLVVSVFVMRCWIYAAYAGFFLCVSTSVVIGGSVLLGLIAHNVLYSFYSMWRNASKGKDKKLQIQG